jgi:hypothetical protein
VEQARPGGVELYLANMQEVMAGKDLRELFHETLKDI